VGPTESQSLSEGLASRTPQSGLWNATVSWGTVWEPLMYRIEQFQHFNCCTVVDAHPAFSFEESVVQEFS